MHPLQADESNHIEGEQQRDACNKKNKTKPDPNSVNPSKLIHSRRPFRLDRLRLISLSPYTGEIHFVSMHSRHSLCIHTVVSFRLSSYSFHPVCLHTLAGFPLFSYTHGVPVQILYYCRAKVFENIGKA